MTAHDDKTELLERWTPETLCVSDLLGLAGGGDWKGLYTRSTTGGYYSNDFQYTSDDKGRRWLIQTHDGTLPDGRRSRAWWAEFTLTWAEMAAYATPLIDEPSRERLRQAQRCYSDVCMEPSASWNDWQSDPEHERRRHEHQARYSATTTEMDAAVAEVFARAWWPCPHCEGQTWEHNYLHRDGCEENSTHPGDCRCDDCTQDVTWDCCPGRADRKDCGTGAHTLGPARPRMISCRRCGRINLDAKPKPDRKVTPAQRAALQRMADGWQPSVSNKTDDETVIALVGNKLVELDMAEVIGTDRWGRRELTITNAGRHAIGAPPSPAPAPAPAPAAKPTLVFSMGGALA